MSKELLLVAPAAVALAAVVLGGAAEAFGRERLSRLGVASLLALAAVLAEWGAMTARPTPVTRAFAPGGVSSAVAAALFALASMAVLASRTASGDVRRAPVPALVAIGALSAALAVAARDLVAMILALESASLAGYALVATAGTHDSDEAAVKYFLQGSLATGLFAYAVALTAGLFDTAGYAAVAASVAASAPSEAVVAAAGLVAAGLAFKAGLVPFHAWVPDAYHASRPAVAGYLASVPKVAAVFAAWVVLRGGVFGRAAVGRAEIVFMALAAASIIVGNVTGLRQRAFGRMLAYSAIAQSGYAAIALGSPSDGGGDYGTFAALLIFLGAYAVAALGAFAVAEWLSASEGWDGCIPGLAGLSRRRPWAAAALAVSMLSLTGIPLTAGFWGKLLLFGSVARGPEVWLAVVAVVGSVVSFGYYGGVIRAAYIDEPSGEPAAKDPAGSRGAAAVALTCAATSVFFGVYPLLAGPSSIAGLLGRL